MISIKALEIRSVASSDTSKLAEFFAALVESGSVFFYPHPLDADAAKERTAYRGRDIYALVLFGPAVVGYGMLRGWDEGFEIPSLGIAVHPAFRSRGIGKMLIEYLHVAATLRGAKQVRLRVSRENTSAKALYERVGYVFTRSDEALQTGWKTL